MFRVELRCSCYVDLIPGNIPVFVQACGCLLEHSMLCPYMDMGIKCIKHIGDLDIAADTLMMQTEEYENFEGLVWQ